MSIATFGITYVEIEPEFDGSDLSGRATDISRWVTQYASEVGTLLRKQGYVPATVAGNGETDDLYHLSRLYIVNRVAARVARASSMQNVSLAETFDAEADRLERLLRAAPLAVSPNSDRKEQRGGARTNVDTVTRALRIRDSVWKPGMKF